MNDIRYIDRTSGKAEREKIYGKWALSLLYGSTRGSRFLAWLLLPLLAHLPSLSRLYGFLQKRPRSRRKIIPFIESFGIDASEFAEPVSAFNSFNDFFIRKLKPECRPIAEDGAILPADGRYLVFPDLSRTEGFYVKGQKFDLRAFLQNPPLARRYADGSMVIARLCPTDYHRFHFPCDGVPERAQRIPGALYSVNPVALSKRLSILGENKRMITDFESDAFGSVLYIEVGATCVGTIHQTYQPNLRVKKGDEKGYFSFGGSCVVILFEKNRIAFSGDLVRNSAQMLETKGLLGQTLGYPL